MATNRVGFPYWEMIFDENGKLEQDATEAALLQEVNDLGLTDLFIFSHGWNNDQGQARGMYDRFFEEMKKLLDDAAITKSGQAVIGTMGVIWPSMRWADEPVPLAVPVAAAGLGGGGPTDAELVRDLKQVFTDDDQQKALDEMADLLASKPPGDEPLARFQQLMKRLDKQHDAKEAPEDDGERRGLLESPPREVFQRFVGLAGPARNEGGAAGMVGDALGRTWDGAKQALRVATYWQMKKRAGVVGQIGLGPLIGRARQARTALRFHLLGHSFGSRLVSFALAGLPDEALMPVSPVKSVTLLQGAFSHFAFANALPHDPGRGGALKGMGRRVDGPLVVTHSKWDFAVGKFYPKASIASGQDAAALPDLIFRWRGMGDDGAQSVQATPRDLGPVGTAYPFVKRQFVNLNGDNVIKKLEPISGAHGDIIHPETAWATLLAAGLVQPN